MRTGFFAFTLLVLSSGSALAAPFDNIITHNAAVPEQSFQLAATWFLPDWQASSSSRTETAPSGSGDRHDLTCSTYGGCAGIPANMTCSQSFRVDGTNCYKSCSCKSGYNRVSSSDVCSGCVNPCDTVSAVSTPYGCQTAWAVCPSKCQVAYPDNCRNRNAVSTPYGCKTAFADCSSKCQTAYPDNCHNRTAVSTPYGCQSAFADCSSKCQTAYPDNCRNYSSKPTVSSCANGCALGKTISDCSSRCSTGCKAKCETGYKLSSDELSCSENGCSSGYEAGKTCGAGYELVKSGQSGTQYCGKCVVKACAAGSTTCSGATVAKENGYYSGDSKCYTCQTCEQAGKKTCNGSCIATSECCGGCASGQKCENGKCVETMDACEQYLRSICTAANKCTINGTYFGGSVTKNIYYGKTLDLADVMIGSDIGGVIFESGASYRHVAACKNAPQAVMTGTFYTGYTGNITFYNVNLQNAVFSSNGAGALIDIIDSNVSSLTTEFTAPNTIEFFDNTSINGTISGSNTNLIFYTAPQSSFGMREISLTGDSFVNFVGVNFDGMITDSTPFQIVLEKLKLSTVKKNNNYNTLMMENVAMYVNYFEQATDLYGTAVISLNGYLEADTIRSPEGSTVEINSQGAFHVNNINASETSFTVYNIGQLRIDSVYLSNGASFALLHQSSSPAVIGSVSLGSGNSVRIYKDGNYSGSSFRPYVY